MIMLKKANRVATLKVKVKTLHLLLTEKRTKARIAAALKRQAERIYR